LHPGEHIIWVNAVLGNCIVSDSLQILVIDNSGVRYHSTANIFLYPNPVENKLGIFSEKPLKIQETIIYNQFGQEVLRSVGDRKMLELSKLKNGLYYIEIVSGNMKAVKKFIKQ